MTLHNIIKLCCFGYHLRRKFDLLNQSITILCQTPIVTSLYWSQKKLTMTNHVMMRAVVIHLLMFVAMIGMNQLVEVLMLLLFVMLVVARQHGEMTKVVWRDPMAIHSDDNLLS